MSILDLHAADTLAAMPARVDVPKSEPKFSAWSMLTAAPRGIAAAGSEISASALELLQPFGATMGRLAGETPDADMGRRMADEVRTGVREGLAPDAQTASAAEQVLYGFARGATKVVLGAPAGPAGFALAGAEEATTAARDLQRQGVWLQAAVLKVPHHGAETSSTVAWLQTVHPQLEIIEVGKDNPFGHPKPEIMARYRDLGIPVLRTDLSGAVEVSSDGRQFWVTSAR